jgi:hypothetical protein
MLLIILLHCTIIDLGAATRSTFQDRESPFFRRPIPDDSLILRHCCTTDGFGFTLCSICHSARVNSQIINEFNHRISFSDFQFQKRESRFSLCLNPAVDSRPGVSIDHYGLKVKFEQTYSLHASLLVRILEPAAKWSLNIGFIAGNLPMCNRFDITAQEPDGPYLDESFSLRDKTLGYLGLQLGGTYQIHNNGNAILSLVTCWSIKRFNDPFVKMNYWQWKRINGIKSWLRIFEFKTESETEPQNPMVVHFQTGFQYKFTIKNSNVFFIQPTVNIGFTDIVTGVITAFPGSSFEKKEPFSLKGSHLAIGFGYIIPSFSRREKNSG